MKTTAPGNRNRAAILEQLQRWWPQTLSVLEVASGSGQHADFFTEHMQGWRWQTSEREVGPDERGGGLDSLRAYQQTRDRTNLLPPVVLDVHATWPPGPFDAVFCCNMIHISPWESTHGLIHGACGVANELVLYGPFLQRGEPTAPSNVRFDEWLKSLSPAFGIRTLQDVLAIAQDAGFGTHQIAHMPANNLMVRMMKR